MSFKRFLAAFAGAGMLALSAGAQTIESEGLGEIDPWASGYISKEDGAFPTSLWSGSRGQDLVPLMQGTAADATDGVLLTPVENSLLRRILLSPGTRPQGENDGLMDERIRLMIAIGEIDAAIDLMRRAGSADYAESADLLTVDMALARGDASTACAGAEKTDPGGMYTLKLRAVCFAMAGDAPGAELSIELAANAGMDDVWLMTTVLAAVADTTSKPDARFEDGLSIAASLAAALPVPSDAFDGVAPHYALALSARPELPAEWRVLAAGISAEAGLADAEAVRAAFAALTEDPDFVPASSLMLAMAALADDTLPVDERAQAFEAALVSAAGRPERFASVSAVLAPGIAALPSDDDTRPYSLIFARAALARANGKEIGRWMSHAKTGGESEIGTLFERALIDNLSLMLTTDTRQDSLDTMAVVLTKATRTDEDRAMAARFFALQSALGVPLPPEARDMLAGSVSQDGLQAGYGDILRLRTLDRSDTSAELVLRALALTRGEPERLATRDLAVVVETLREAGLVDDARKLALEGMAYWKP